eukprot:9467565-Pyramimonas_sp.AAC.2
MVQGKGDVLGERWRGARLWGSVSAWNPHDAEGVGERRGEWPDYLPKRLRAGDAEGPGSPQAHLRSSNLYDPSRALFCGPLLVWPQRGQGRHWRRRSGGGRQGEAGALPGRDRWLLEEPSWCRAPSVGARAGQFRHGHPRRFVGRLARRLRVPHFSACPVPGHAVGVLRGVAGRIVHLSHERGERHGGAQRREGLAVRDLVGQARGARRSVIEARTRPPARSTGPRPAQLSSLLSPSPSSRGVDIRRETQYDGG